MDADCQWTRTAAAVCYKRTFISLSVRADTRHRRRADDHRTARCSSARPTARDASTVARGQARRRRQGQGRAQVHLLVVARAVSEAFQARRKISDNFHILPSVYVRYTYACSYARIRKRAAQCRQRTRKTY